MPFATDAKRKHSRKRIARRVSAGEPCHLCGNSIDLSIKYPHDEAFVVDHITPSSLGGLDHSDNLRPAHAGCNRRRSALPAGSVGRNSGVLG